MLRFQDFSDFLLSLHTFTALSPSVIVKHDTGLGLLERKIH